MIDFPDAETAYAAVAEMGAALRGLRMPELAAGEFDHLQTRDRAARAWLDAHPAEAREYRIRSQFASLHYAVCELANRADPGERITLAEMLQDAADDLAGEARDLIQAERDKVTDADRARRMSEMMAGADVAFATERRRAAS